MLSPKNMKYENMKYFSTWRNKDKCDLAFATKKPTLNLSDLISPTTIQVQRGLDMDGVIIHHILHLPCPRIINISPATYFKVPQFG